MQLLLKRLDSLERECAQLRKENAELRARCEKQQLIIDQLLRHRFGKRSEKMAPDEQLSLLGDLSEFTDPASDDEADDSPKPQGNNKKRKQKRFCYPNDLPRETVKIDVDAKDRMCDCGQEKSVIGFDTVEVLDYVPEQFKIRVEQHLKRACSCCKNGVCSPKVKRALPGVRVSHELLAQLIIAKCLDRQPHYHLSTRWTSRHDVTIPRESLSRWMIQLANHLQPLYNLMAEQLDNYDIGSLDATWLKVLKEPNRSPTTTSKAWCFKGGAPGNEVTLYEYCANDHAGFVQNRWSEFQGTLHGDVDRSYERLQNNGIKLSYCHAHSRRKYQPIAEAASTPGIAAYVIKQYQKLYQLEKLSKDWEPELRLALRQSKSKPILDNLRQYLLDRYAHIPGGLKLKEAVTYTLNHWDNLNRFLDDGRLSIDNNHTERDIRPFVMARNNFLFADTPKGARALCLHFSIIQTAKQHNIEPYQYYVHILNQLPYCKTVEDYEALLPWHDSIQNIRLQKKWA